MHIYVLNCHFDLYKTHFVTLYINLFKRTKLELYNSDIPDIKFEKLYFGTKGVVLGNIIELSLGILLSTLEKSLKHPGAPMTTPRNTLQIPMKHFFHLN